MFSGNQITEVFNTDVTELGYDVAIEVSINFWALSISEYRYPRNVTKIQVAGMWHAILVGEYLHTCSTFRLSTFFFCGFFLLLDFVVSVWSSLSTSIVG